MEEYEDEYDYELEENPASHIQPVNWGRMKEFRLRFITKGIEDLASRAELVLEEPQFKQDDKGKWQMRGGPYLSFPDTLYYVSKGGNEIPQRVASIFTWTTKMSCASFSVPAGPLSSGGTCLASRERNFPGYLPYHEPLLSGEDERGDILYLDTTGKERSLPKRYLCDVCYAGKGAYLRYPSAAINQLAHFYWADSLLRQGKEGMKEVVDTLVQSLEFIYHSAKMRNSLSRQLVDPSFFRIHDAGDFWSFDYYKAWRKVCKHFENRIKFWAPTRQWVFPKWMSLFKRFPPPSNLALRPSALFLGAKPPKILDSSRTGERVMAGGSTSYPYTWIDPPNWTNRVWDCPASVAVDDKSCIESMRPDGEIGCRFCWFRTHRTQPVNYSTH